MTASAQLKAAERCHTDVAGEGVTMQIFIGPVLTRDRGYAFDSWTSEEGLRRGYTYRIIEEAHYARKFDIRRRVKDPSDRTVACNTVDEFIHLTGASHSAMTSRMQFR